MWRIIFELFLILKTIHSREKWNDKFEPIILLERYEIVHATTIFKTYIANSKKHLW